MVAAIEFALSRALRIDGDDHPVAARNLMRAIHDAAAAGQLSDVHLDYLTAGKCRLDHRAGSLVAEYTESRHDDPAIGDVEIYVRSAEQPVRCLHVVGVVD